tara:strand:- start:471 stop:1100 length:630 start_codon:yes stop_codon:yes gene_type:complete
MKLKVHSINGKATEKTVSLKSHIFGIEPNEHAIYLDVKQYLASQRSGTHKSKERGEIKGSRRKLRKQKGSGAARVGDIKNPLFKGGGRVFGPRVRKYGFKLNKKVKLLARKSILSQKYKDDSIMILEDFKIKKPSTKEYLSILSNFDQVNSKTLLILSKSDQNIYLSSRNVKSSKVVSVNSLTTYDLINANKIMFVEDSIKSFQNQIKE